MKLLMICLLLIGPVTVAWGEELPPELRDALPADAEQLLDGLNGEFSDHDALVSGLGLLWDKARELFYNVLRSNTGNLALLLAVVLLCGLMDELRKASDPDKTGLIPMAGALAITVLSVGSLRALIGLGRETLEQMDLFGKMLLPTLSAAVAAGGGVVTAGISQVATVFFADTLITVINNVLLPLVYCYIAVAMADAALTGSEFKRLRIGIGKVVIWGMMGLLTAYVAFLKISGAATAAADSTAVRLTRSAISASVPVVGGIISDATETVTAGAELLKNSIGIFGMLSVLAICLLPFVHLAMQFLLYKLTAFLAAAVGPEQLVQLVDAIGTAFGLVLGMVGACGLVLLIAVISSVSVVIR